MVVKSNYNDMMQSGGLKNLKSGVLHEISPLSEFDFMHVIDRHKKEFTYPLHDHDVFELNYVENAAGCRRVVGDSSEVIGDRNLVLIMNPQLPHVWEQHKCCSEDIHEITIHFRLNYETEGTPFLTNQYLQLNRMLNRAKRGLAFSCQTIHKVEAIINKLAIEHHSYLAAHEFYLILWELSMDKDSRCLASSSFAHVGGETHNDRIVKVLRYIQLHYKEDINRDTLSNAVAMTPSSFSHYFKSITGKSLTDYVVDVRLGHAARKLIETDETISRIAYACGFNSLTNFNRLFRKRKGYCPKEFREIFYDTRLFL